MIGDGCCLTGCYRIAACCGGDRCILKFLQIFVLFALSKKISNFHDTQSLS